MDRSVLEKKALAELRQIAAALELRGYQRIRKADLVTLIIDAATAASDQAAKRANGNGDSADNSTDRSAADPSPSANADADADTQASKADVAEDTKGDERSGAAETPARPVRPARAGQGERGGRRDERRSSDSDRGSQRPNEPQRTRDERGNPDVRDGRGADDGHANDGDDQSEAQHDSGASRARSKRDRRRKSRGQQNQGGDGFDDAEVRTGVLDLLPEGYGFLRVTGYLAGDQDVYVSQSFVRRFDLRRGDQVTGPIRRNKNNDKFPALARVDAIEEEKIDGPGSSDRPDFGGLTPLFPDERLRLETDDSPMTMRLIDMMAPIGKGQRALVVSPPKAGKTTVLKQLAAAVEANHPEAHLMVVLVDERPEEVTDFARSTSGEVISSTFDRPAEDHTQVAELALERAKRLVERGRDVVVLLDSITRLGRAYNLAAPASGRVLSGGIDSAALYPPKRFFGSARNIEEGGSFTIVATALVDTGSRMDDVIFEEFKGTGNMELRLDRRLEQKRIFPALDIAASGTRREDLLLEKDALETVWKLRRVLATMEPEPALQLLIDKLKATESNEQFLQLVERSNLQ